MNYFDLLKAKHGLPVSDAYTALLGKKLQGGGYPVTEIFGQLPFSFLSHGASISEWTLYGKTVQNGTPTPTSPIPVQGVGDRTVNLFDKTSNIVNFYIASGTGVYTPTGSTSRSILVRCKPHTTYTIYVPTNRTLRVVSFEEYPASGDVGDNYFDRPTSGYVDKTVSITTADTAQYLCIFCYNSSEEATQYDENAYFSQIMLNEGSTALPYEPYGYKIQISCGGTTQTVYLDKPLYGDGTNIDYLQRLADGSGVEHRAWREFVLDGTEAWFEATPGVHRLTVEGYLREDINVPFCTHYKGISPVDAAISVGDLQTAFLISSSGNNYIYIRDNSFTTASQFKTYLAEQYAAGTPVTVWYVLAEPTTGIVNEPLMKIRDYADELHSTDAGVEIPTAAGVNTLTTDTTVHGDARIKGRIQEI